MRVRSLTHGESRVFIVVLEPAEEVTRELTRFAGDESVNAAHFTAIGAFQSARLGWFDLDAKDYRVTEVRRQAEVVSLVGDITFADVDGTEPKIHAHVVLGLPDGRALGGHLLRGHVRPTLEVMVTETPAVLRRRYDPETGLALIDPTTLPGAPDGGQAGGPDGQDRG